MILSDPLLVVATLARVFDDLSIRYLVGGSLASSLYGIPRATQDVDLVADVRLPHVEPIMTALTEEFYADADMIREAIKNRASFNVIHLATMFKADVFIMRGDAWSCEEMARARTEQFEVPGGRVTVRFASPEDTLRHKLGNQISDRQWGDSRRGCLRRRGLPGRGPRRTPWRGGIGPAASRLQSVSGALPSRWREAICR